MIKLLCVGKECTWDYMSRNTEYFIEVVAVLGAGQSTIKVSEQDWEQFHPGQWYEFEYQIYVAPPEEA